MNALVMYQHASRRSSPRHDAEGQATTEFLVALLVMVPLFFGTYYFARYSDVKHSAIQASAFLCDWPVNKRASYALLAQPVAWCTSFWNPPYIFFAP